MLRCEFGYVLKRTWAEEVRNVSILVAFGVNEQGFREILGATEGAKEDKTGWSSFLSNLKQRGLNGLRLFISDKCMGLVESLGEFFPEARWQRCTVGLLKKLVLTTGNAFSGLELVPVLAGGNHAWTTAEGSRSAVHGGVTARVDT